MLTECHTPIVFAITASLPSDSGVPGGPGVCHQDGPHPEHPLVAVHQGTHPVSRQGAWAWLTQSLQGGA